MGHVRRPRTTFWPFHLIPRQQLSQEHFDLGRGKVPSRTRVSAGAEVDRVIRDVAEMELVGVHSLPEMKEAVAIKLLRVRVYGWIMVQLIVGEAKLRICWNVEAVSEGVRPDSGALYRDCRSRQPPNRALISHGSSEESDPAQRDYIAGFPS